ncbi:hypothetical protein BDQ94DRAFT_176377 [Aspergillus welwitschiae]|uniref:Ferric oxidoreductase domain-containing protein n=1 Tax=Aspergillus welwitschiae TaxID=1341132 RepID=A0A3F3PI49_9EURO|nr:hypothetical protein BDQ94DRAFT_176377 [Aspergillus welwitschiae]RDH26443.1 hypothetical protein BDQ94DRAFT_176377 [Aspergillus welwitschiae]
MSSTLSDVYKQAIQIQYVDCLVDGLSNARLRSPLGGASAHGWAGVQQRAAKLAVLNLLPLSTGLTFGLPAHLLGISRSAVAWLHRWFARVMTAHSLLHGAVAIARADKPIPSMRHDWVPLLAAAAILTMIPVTLHVVVRRHCQVAMRIHYLLAITAMVALGYHTWDQESQYRWQVPPASVHDSTSVNGYTSVDSLHCCWGHTADFSLFGTIVFIVEDIGMLRVLPYIRMLVQASEHGRAMGSERILDHQCWLGDWMQDLLDLDCGGFKILDFHLYYLTKTTSVNPVTRSESESNYVKGH